MKKTFVALALAAATLIPFGSAQAAVISFTDSIETKLTDWDETINLGKFDTRLGTLNSVRFDLSGFVEGIGLVENRGARARTVTLGLSSELTLMRPDGSLLVVSTPEARGTLNLTAYDQVDDLKGSSGGSTGLIKSSASEYFISSNASDFALFSAKGGGMIDLMLEALAYSNTIGTGNFRTDFTTYAGGIATVTYDYTPFVVEVPEPATLATMIAGLGLIGAARRRSRSKAQ